MNDVPFETRRLLRDLPELLAGPDPVLRSEAAQARLAEDPAARGMLVAALEIGAALEGSASAVRGARRTVAPRILTSVDRARRFFRRRLVEVGQEVGAACFHARRSADDVFFENAELVSPARGDEADRLASLRSGLGLANDDTVESALLTAMREQDPKRIFELCVGMNTGSEYAMFFHVLLGADSTRKAQEWTELASRARTREIAGWAWIHAATAKEVAGMGKQSLYALDEARRHITSSVTMSYNRLYFAVLHGSSRQIIESAAALTALPLLPESSISTVRRNTDWSRFGKRERRTDFALALRMMPTSLAAAIEESLR